MDFSCPSCGRSLKEAPPKAVPLPGARKFLPPYKRFACPSCKRRVAVNWHPIERRVRIADAGALLLFSLLAYFSHEILIFYAGMILSSLGEIAFWLWARKRLHAWKRYALAGQP